MPNLILHNLVVHNPKLNPNVGNSLHILLALVSTKELVHLLNSDSLGFRHEEEDPNTEEETET
jgi:hypothetical protein